MTDEGSARQELTRCPTCHGPINRCSHSKSNVVIRNLNDGSGMSQAHCWECEHPVAAPKDAPLSARQESAR